MEKKEITTLVKELYYDYAKYVNIGGRTVPYVYDTLKTVQRRVLLAAYDLTKNGNFVKSAKIVGHTIGSYHPHGDQSCYGVLVNMVQQGLLEGRGNFGATAGLSRISAASYRYTECRLSPKIKEIAFKYLSVVPHYENELNTKEPEYLPTMLPLNLISFSEQSEPVSGIGVGDNMKFVLPTFDEKEVINYFIKLIDNKITQDEKLNIVYKKIKQKAPKGLMTKGKATIKMNGLYEISEDQREIIIKEFPFNPLRLPSTMISKIDGIPIDKSTKSTEVVIKLDKGKRANDFKLDELLTSNVTYDMMFHDKEFIKLYGVKELFSIIYDTYKKSVLTDLNIKKDNIEKKIDYIKKVIQMKPYLKNLDKDSAKKISSEIKIKEEEVEEIFKKTNLDMLAHIDERLSQAKKELKVIANNIKDIDNFCKSHYEALL